MNFLLCVSPVRSRVFPQLPGGATAGYKPTEPMTNNARRRSLLPQEIALQRKYWKQRSPYSE
jgi:hypothetical protein